MRKDLKLRQERMRRRQALARVKSTEPALPRPTDAIPAAVWNPVDYSRRVEYTSEVRLLIYFPRFNGIYLLTEGGRFYIGQSVDVQARFSSHRIRPVCCHFVDPRGALLATVPEKPRGTYSENAHVRLNAEARFIAAALSLGLPLTNKLSEPKRAKLAAMFPELDRERERLKTALEILAADCAVSGGLEVRPGGIQLC